MSNWTQDLWIEKSYFPASRNSLVWANTGKTLLDQGMYENLLKKLVIIIN